MKPQSNLGKVVTRRTYSREDNGVPETWKDITERVLAGNIRNVTSKELLPDEIDRLRYFMLERKAMGAGRVLWFSGAPSHAALGGAALNNCFSGDTEILTNLGIKKLTDVAGTSVCVLDGNRSWVKSEILCHGEQEIYELVLRRNGSTKRIKTTAEHLWFARRTTKENLTAYTTASLPIGGYIPRLAPFIVEELSHEGVAHGITFGDGTSNHEHGCSVHLCGEKIELSKYFSRAGETISYLPGHYKTLPALTESRNYLAGFFAGLLATDGCVSTGISISNRSRDTIEHIRNIASILGIEITNIREEVNFSNYTNKVETLQVISFNQALFPEHLILRTKHKDNWNNTKRKKRDYWTIESVTPLGQKEKVYCPIVPTTHSFALEGNILTGNCWVVTLENWYNFVIAEDLLMLGGGVGASVEHRYVSKLPKVKRGVKIVHKNTKDADFIVPDSREGWCKLSYLIYEAYFVTGKGFTWSTICIRGAGEAIRGFGGKASGSPPLIEFVTKLCEILDAREGRHIRPIDAGDIICCIGELVVSGNVRRSAIILVGDPWDKEYLKAKRWDLGVLPTQRSCANFSVVCDDVDDLHPLYWKTYEVGEPFGLVNRKNIQKYGRMGELKKDTAVTVNPCGESCLESYEPCNLQEIFLPNLNNKEEFFEAARLMHRFGKRICLEKYHHPEIDEVIHRNNRIGTGITGCLQSSLFNPTTLDEAYEVIQKENVSYSKQLGIPPSIRTTLVKPSGTLSLVGDCTPGIHPAFSKFYIRRVRFASNDRLIPVLKDAGHHIEPVKRFDGTLDHNTLVVDFYCETPDGTPCADSGFDTWKQLDTLLLAQKHWADQAVSVTVYYRKEEIPEIKKWLSNNLKYLKTISFLCHNDHGFIQAPIEAMTQEDYEKKASKVKPIDFDTITSGELESLECEGGVCPIK